MLTSEHPEVRLFEIGWSGGKATRDRAAVPTGLSRRAGPAVSIGFGAAMRASSYVLIAAAAVASIPVPVLMSALFLLGIQVGFPAGR